MGCSNSARRSSNVSLPAVESGFVMSETEKALLRSTWKKVSYDMPGVGAKVFTFIFNNHPNIKELFPSRDLAGQALLQDQNFKSHSVRFMQALGAAVDNVDNLDATMVPLLHSLGHDHIHYRGFSMDYFDSFAEAILDVWEEVLQDEYNLEVSFLWRQVVDFMVAKMKEGYMNAMKKETPHYGFGGGHKRGDSRLV